MFETLQSPPELVEVVNGWSSPPPSTPLGPNQRRVTTPFGMPGSPESWVVSPSASRNTRPEAAVRTATVAVEESLVGSESVVVVVPVAVLPGELVVPAPTWTTSVNAALAPAARLERVSVTVPLLPTVGVVDPKDGPLSCVSDTKVVPAGSGS